MTGPVGVLTSDHSYLMQDSPNTQVWLRDSPSAWPKLAENCIAFEVLSTQSSSLPHLLPFICIRPTLWSDSVSYLLLPSHFILQKHFPKKSLGHLIPSWTLLKGFNMAQLSKWVWYLNISFPSQSSSPEHKHL